MANEAPWEVSRRAADRVEELASNFAKANSAEGARRRQWMTETGPLKPAYTWPVVTAFIVDEITNPVLDAGEAWAACFGPHLAEPLVAWLRDAADAAEEHKDDKTAPVNMGKRLCSNELKALDLALAILGEA